MSPKRRKHQKRNFDASSGTSRPGDFVCNKDTDGPTYEEVKDILDDGTVIIDNKNNEDCGQVIYSISRKSPKYINPGP